MRKIFRQIQRELNRKPYHREEGLPDLTINYFINQRSDGDNWCFSVQEILFERLKKSGFFEWYPGRTVNGQKNHIAPWSSIYSHAHTIAKYPVDRPVRQYRMEYGITILSKDGWVSAKACNGWARYTIGQEDVILKLTDGKWVESHRNQITDLPF